MHLGQKWYGYFSIILIILVFWVFDNIISLVWKFGDIVCMEGIFIKDVRKKEKVAIQGQIVQNQAGKQMCSYDE